MELGYTNLKERHRKERDKQSDSLSLRLHRALSWLNKAEQSVDDDSRFIFLWIAFNSAYSQETGLAHISDGQKYAEFLKVIVDLDVDQLMHDYLWKEFTQAIRVLLDNPYVFQPYWNHQNGIAGYEDWEDSFNNAKKTAQAALLNKDTSLVLHIIFSRLYTLRNQIMHGGATWNSQTNRQQLKDGVKILGKLVPAIIEVMMRHPEKLWGDACYPVKSAQ